MYTPLTPGEKILGYLPWHKYLYTCKYNEYLQLFKMYVNFLMGGCAYKNELNGELDVFVCVFFEGIETSGFPPWDLWYAGICP